MTQNYVSFSCQSKQVSRCCINFPHELTCQILTNQSIKIGRRAWPTRDHGKKRSSPPVFFKKLAECLRLKSVWNQNRNSAGRYWHKHNIWYKKSKREPAIIWKRINCQRITSKNTRPWWVDTWARDTVRWYWSANTLFWQLSIDHNISVQYLCNISFSFLPN